MHEELNGKKKFSNLLIKFDSILGIIETNVAIICYAFMIVVVLAGIVMRFILRIPNIYGEELSMHLLFLTTIFGISMAIRKRSHLGIEMFVEMFPEKFKNNLKKISSIIVILVYCFFTYTIFLLAFESKKTILRTSAIGIPYYVIYLVMGLYSIVFILRSIVLFWNDYISKEKILKEEGGVIIE